MTERGSKRQFKHWRKRALQRRDSSLLCISNESFQGLTSERKRQCNVTLTHSTRAHQTPTGSKSVFKSYCVQCTRTGITPSNTTNISWRQTWSKLIERRKSRSSIWQILTDSSTSRSRCWLVTQS